MRPRPWILLALFVLSGCAHGSMSGERVASASAYMCKHCNCFMPAGVDPQKTCPACKCGYPAYACRRGVW